MYFLLTHLDLILVPAGLMLIFLAVAWYLYIRWRMKKGLNTWGWHTSPICSTDTDPHSLEDPLEDDINTDPAYHSLSVNLYNEDRWGSSS